MQCDPSSSYLTCVVIAAIAAACGVCIVAVVENTDRSADWDYKSTVMEEIIRILFLLHVQPMVSRPPTLRFTINCKISLCRKLIGSVLDVSLVYSIAAAAVISVCCLYMSWADHACERGSWSSRHLHVLLGAWAGRDREHRKLWPKSPTKSTLIYTVIPLESFFCKKIARKTAHPSAHAQGNPT